MVLVVLHFQLWPMDERIDLHSATDGSGVVGLPVVAGSLVELGLVPTSNHVVAKEGVGPHTARVEVAKVDPPCVVLVRPTVLRFETYVVVANIVLRFAFLLFSIQVWQKFGRLVTFVLLLVAVEYYLPPAQASG